MPKPGDTVQLSGIYRVTHEGNHTQPHDATCVAGKKFPRCQGCEEPQFILASPAQDIETHRLFKKKKKSVKR